MLEQDDPSTSWLKLVVLATLSTLGFLLLLVVGTVVFAGFFVYSSLQSFANTADTTIPALIETVRTGTKTPLVNTDGKVTFLVLGSDQLPTRGDAPELTDTILLATINTQNAQVGLYSLPRDLWLPDYKTKVNALYAYGKQREPSDPTRFPKAVISELTGMPIHYVIVVHLQTLSQLIDAVGGIEVNVEEAFTDTQFPRPDVDVTKEHDPAKLYQTVTFEHGVEVMSGERVLQYIRSRHATGNQGTDTARAKRQQAVISALLQRLRSPQFWGDVGRVALLYKFYNQQFAQTFPVTQGIALAVATWPAKSSFNLHTGTATIFPDDAKGALVHPPLSKYRGQWVYEVRDLNLLRESIQQTLTSPAKKE